MTRSEMTDVVTKSNKKRIEYAQTSDSTSYRCMKDQRYRECRIRACEGENVVCSSLPRCLITESEFYSGIKSGSENVMIDSTQRVLDVSDE